MNYRELRDSLNELSDEQLNMTASVYDAYTNEIWTITDTFMASEIQDLGDIVESNQPLLISSNT